MEDLSGKQLGQYEIVAPLGEGGMAAVYKAYQAAIDRFVALKILPRHLATDPSFSKRFEQEAKVIAKLEHPNILPVYDYGQTGEYAYIAMRLVEGGTLEDLAARATLDLSQVCRFIGQIGEALDYAHSRGVIHRDIKPSNVLLDQSGNCLLTDFGIARIVGGSSHITQTGAIIGTPAYMSPEQGLAQLVDARSDIYSLGVVLFELLTGTLPFKADTPIGVVMMHIQHPLPPPGMLNPLVPPSIERVAIKALAKRPDERFSTAGEMARELRRAASGLTDDRGYDLPTIRIPARATHDAAAVNAREEDAIKQYRQLLLYRRAGAQKGLAYSGIIFFGLFLVALVGLTVAALSGALKGPDDNQAKPNWPGVIGVSAAISALLALSFSLLKKSKHTAEELAEMVEQEGNYYCCQCGAPKKRYYWLHYLLTFGVPGWGLLSLFFPLKRCRNCGRLYNSADGRRAFSAR